MSALRGSAWINGRGSRANAACRLSSPSPTCLRRRQSRLPQSLRLSGVQCRHADGAFYHEGYEKMARAQRLPRSSNGGIPLIARRQIFGFVWDFRLRSELDGVQQRNEGRSPTRELWFPKSDVLLSRPRFL